MSSPIRPPLTVETIDGATVGRPITKIKVTNGALAVSGSTATLTISGGGGGSGTVTSIGLTETGSALTITGSPVTTSGTINIAGAGTSSQVILGDLTLGTLTSGTVTSVSGTTPISSSGGATPTISINQADTTTDGYLSSTDWNTFNDKQDSITLTTSGTSGASTLIGSTLNIPQYAGGGGGTIGGSIANTQVARGATTSNEIEGDNGLLFDGTSFTVNTLSSSNPVLNMSSNTKSVSLEAETNQTLSIKGSANKFIFDASSATSGITWPDGTEQVSAATLTSITGTSPISVSAGTTPVISLDNSGVTGGIYTNASITVDAKGLVTAASSGSTPGTVNGTGANGQVAFWIDTDEIDGSTGLTYDSATGNLTVGGHVSSGDGKITTPSGTNLTLEPGGASSGSIGIVDGANGQISISPNGTGVIKLGGANNPVTVSNAYSLPTVVTTDNNYVLTAQTDGSTAWAASGGGGGGAPTSAEYVTLATDASLTNERVLTNGQSIRIIDSGAGNNVTVQSGVFNAPRAKEAGDRWVVTKMPPYNLGTSGLGVQTSTSYDRPSFYTFIAPASGEIDELGIYISTAASSACNALLGVYTTTDDGWPDELMGYATFDVTTTGAKLSTSFTYANSYTAIRTNAGETYWIGFVRDTTSVSFSVYAVQTSNSAQMVYAVGSGNPIFASYGFQYTASPNALPTLPNKTSWTGTSTEVYAHTSISYAV